MSAALSAPPPEAVAGRVLLASEGREFSAAAIERAADFAAAGTTVQVLSIARVWGTALGFPNPWLMPSRHEWAAQRQHVDRAIAALARLGVAAEGRVIGTRNAAGKIVSEARRLASDVIVMGADAPPSRFLGAVLWSQEPYRVKAKAGMAVVLEVEGREELLL